MYIINVILTLFSHHEGLSTGAIIGIAAGAGGAILIIMIIGGVLCIAALRPRSPAVRGRPFVSQDRRPPPLSFNGPAGYPVDYGYGQPRVGYKVSFTINTCRCSITYSMNPMTTLVFPVNGDIQILNTCFI